MPALRAYGRRWHLATEDLPPFAAAGFLFHFVWAVFLAAAIGLAEDRNDCEGLTELFAYADALVAIDVLQSLTLGALVFVSLQGSRELPHASWHGCFDHRPD